MKISFKVWSVLLLLGLAIVGCDSKPPQLTKIAHREDEEPLQKPDFDSAAPAIEEKIKRERNPEQEKDIQEALKNYRIAEKGIAKVMMEHGTLEHVLEAYKEQNLGAEKVETRTPNTAFSADNFAEVVKYLKLASSIQLKGDLAPLNSVGKALTEAAQAFSSTLLEMDSYLSKKEYEKDQFAKARDLDPIFIKKAQDFITAYDNFGKVSAEVDQNENKLLVEKLIQEGAMRQAYSFQAYGHALRFLTIAFFNNIKDPAVEVELTNQIKQMDETLEKMKAENQKVKDIKSSKFANAEESLSQLLVAMREAKTAKYEPTVMHTFIKKYNYFVRHTLNLGMLN